MAWAGMSDAQLQQWNNQFLGDLGVSGNNNPNIYNNDYQFLLHWENREGIGDRAVFNPLGSTRQEPGSVPINSVGVQSYADLSSGANANAYSLLSPSVPGYPQLLNAFQTGTADINQNYQGLHSWSAGPNAAANQGYWNLAGTGTSTGPASSGSPSNPVQSGGSTPGAPPGTPDPNKVAAAQAGITDQYLRRQIDLQYQLAAIDEQFAKKEASFQNQLLGLSKQSLGIQEGALTRAMAEAPELQADVQKIYQLQYGGIKQAGEDTNRQYRQQLINQSAQNAGTGGAFTKGARDEHANTMADWASATASLQRQRSTLQAQQNQEAIGYLEKLAAYQDQKKQYDLISQRYGIQGQEIMARLGSTLQQTAIGAGMNIADLFTQVANTDASLIGTVPGPNISPGLTSSPYAQDPTQAYSQSPGSFGFGYGP
jgi:hypothetical protein